MPKFNSEGLVRDIHGMVRAACALQVVCYEMLDAPFGENDTDTQALKAMETIHAEIGKRIKAIKKGL